MTSRDGDNTSNWHDAWVGVPSFGLVVCNRSHGRNTPKLIFPIGGRTKRVMCSSDECKFAYDFDYPINKRYLQNGLLVPGVKLRT